MKRFLIHVSTSWCGMDDTFRAMAENDYELDEIANQLAYENFQFYDCENDIAEEFGYDPDDMEDEDWDKLWEQTSEGDYYHYTIEEFEGDDEEWEEYDGEIYGKGRMMEDFKFYEVGGKIRDEFLGIKSKDVDYVAVPSKEVFDKIHPRES